MTQLPQAARTLLVPIEGTKETYHTFCRAILVGSAEVTIDEFGTGSIVLSTEAKRAGTFNEHVVQSEGVRPRKEDQLALPEDRHSVSTGNCELELIPELMKD